MNKLRQFAFFVFVKKKNPFHATLRGNIKNSVRISNMPPPFCCFLAYNKCAADDFENFEATILKLTLNISIMNMSNSPLSQSPT